MKMKYSKAFGLLYHYTLSSI